VQAQRAALSVVAVGLVGGAAVASTLSAGSEPPARRPQPPSRAAPAQLRPPSPYGGEPELPPRSHVPPAAFAAAVRFVRDYEAWSAGRLAAIPRGDATVRVIRLLEQAGRLPGQFSPRWVGSLRIATVGIDRYVVTSVVGNFLVGRIRSHWLVVSLPGD
jgi:hypothetical protein